MQAIDRYRNDAGIAQRYLAGQLSPEEQEAYEQYFLNNPDAVRELEATARLKVGLAALRDGGQLDTLLRGTASPSARTTWLAIAASLAVVAITVGVWREARTPAGAALMATATQLLDSSGKPLALGASYVLLRTRAADHDAVVVLPVEPRAIELRVMPEYVAAAYDVTLSRIGTGSGASIGTERAVTRGGDGYVRTFVDSSKLEPGVWSLELEPAQDRIGVGPERVEVAESSFRLRVVGASAVGDPEIGVADHGQ